MAKRRRTRRRGIAAALARWLVALKPARTAPWALFCFAIATASYLLFVVAFAASGNGAIRSVSRRSVSQGWSLQADWNATLWLETDPPISLTQLPREFRGQRGEIYSHHAMGHAANGALAPIFKYERRYFIISLDQASLSRTQLHDIRLELRKHETELPPALRAAFNSGNGTAWRPIAPSTPAEVLSWFVFLGWWAFVVIATLTVFLWLGGRWTIERIVLRLGYCPNCCYPRAGIAGMQCPECGRWTRKVNRAALLRSPPICPSPSPPNPSSSPAPPPA